MFHNKRGKKTLPTVAASAVLAVASLAGGPANEASANEIVQEGCEERGFKGVVRVNQTDSGSPRTATIFYAITGAGSEDGNSANVQASDSGAATGVSLATDDNAIQDGQYHRLGSVYQREPHNRITIYFTFDDANLPDPACSVDIDM